jgi:hypothetical protein
VTGGKKSGAMLFGFAAGAAAGVFFWSSIRHSYRRNLFSRRPLERFIALTYLAARPTFETARVLGDYIRWEAQPALRRQAMRLLQRIETHLRESA